MGRNSQLWPLQVALATAIAADATLQGILAGDMVYSVSPPENTPYPYITFGLVQENDDNLFGKPGTLAGQVLDIWTRKTTTTGGATQEIGGRQVLQIYGALRHLLHQQPLTVTGFSVVNGLVSLLATMDDPDGITVHGVARYDVTSRG
ncbi:MAG: DUF3168 domain-containing protein [Gemmatimonadaceae bacterium]